MIEFAAFLFIVIVAIVFWPITRLILGLGILLAGTGLAIALVVFTWYAVTA